MKIIDYDTKSDVDVIKLLKIADVLDTAARLYTSEYNSKELTQKDMKDLCEKISKAIRSAICWR